MDIIKNAISEGADIISMLYMMNFTLKIIMLILSALYWRTEYLSRKNDKWYFAPLIFTVVAVAIVLFILP